MTLATETVRACTSTGVDAGDPLDVVVRPLEERDLAAADRVFRLAFGTMIGLPDPSRFGEGSELVRCRFAGDAGAAFAAEIDGKLVGTAFVTRRGSVLVFGPLSVHPDYWDRGVGNRLWAARLPLLESPGVTHAGLFTAPHSTKHVHLYRKFGFWPRFLTAVTAKPVPAPKGTGFGQLSTLPESDRKAIIERCRALTDEIYPGLDLSREIRAALERGVGDLVFVDEDDGLAGFALCHAGVGSEAPPDTCFLKFGAARPGVGVPERFERLLEAVEELAAVRGLARLETAVNMARYDAARILAGRGYQTFLQGVAMHRPNAAGYDREDVFVVDDWR